MTQEHPITPPPELMHRLQDLGNLDAIELAYQAGAGQELEACCEWLGQRLLGDMLADKLRAARRPKPPSLKEQALLALSHLEKGAEPQMDATEASYTIRRALESLPS